VSAQAAFKILITEHIAPELRRLGWQGSMGKWHLPHQTQWVMLSLGRTTYRCADHADAARVMLGAE
jgi:hypothetical protein